MRFRDLNDRLSGAVMKHLADDESATYYPQSGTPVPGVRVIIDHDVEPTQGGQPSTTVERRTELTGYHADLGDARRGELIEADGHSWRLDRKDRDDGHLVTWWVTPVL